MRPFSVLTGSLLAALAVAVPAADAKTVRYHNVVSPSGKIACYQMKYGGPAVECSVPGLPRVTDFGDPIIHLSARGHAKIGARSDFPGYPGTQRKLAYGDRWYTGRGGKIRCTMRTSGLTCVNRDGHGFRAAANATKRF